jgi:hypothetical protein
MRMDHHLLSVALSRRPQHIRMARWRVKTRAGRGRRSGLVLSRLPKPCDKLKKRESGSAGSSTAVGSQLTIRKAERSEAWRSRLSYPLQA